MCGRTPAIPAPRRLRQEDAKFRAASLDYIREPCLRKRNKRWGYLQGAPGARVNILLAEGGYRV
jgi:hypothetical protein